jgi:hypothetical protein
MDIKTTRSLRAVMTIDFRDDPMHARPLYTEPYGQSRRQGRVERVTLAADLEDGNYISISASAYALKNDGTAGRAPMRVSYGRLGSLDPVARDGLLAQFLEFIAAEQEALGLPAVPPQP